MLTTAAAVAALGLALTLRFNAVLTGAVVVVVVAAAAWFSHRQTRGQEEIMRRLDDHHAEWREANDSLQAELEAHSRTADNAFRLIALDQVAGDGTHGQHGRHARAAGPSSGGTLHCLPVRRRAK